MPPLVLLAVGMVVGTATWPLIQPTFAETTLAAVACLALAAFAARSSQTGRLGIAAAGLLLGLAGPSSLPAPPHLVGDLRLRGRVVTAAWGTRADVAVSSVAPPGEAWTPTSGRIRVRFPGPPPPPGTAVVLSGRAGPLDPGALPGAPDPAWEAAIAGVATELRAGQVVRIGPPLPTFRLEGATNAGLLRAMLDGDRTGVSEEVAARMRRTGTWHLVSISGLHIGLCATAAWGIVWLLTRPLALRWRAGHLRWVCAAAAIAAACAYAGVAGWPLPARRAAWMSAVGALLAARGGRPGAAELLSLAWIGTSLAEPAALLNPGAQLSFGALAGIALVGPRLTRLVPPDSPDFLRIFVASLGTSLGAIAGTLPTVAWSFQDLSVTAPMANLLAVPLMGTVATPLLLASQVLPGPLGRLALWGADHACSLALLLLVPFDIPPTHVAVGAVGAALLVLGVLLRRYGFAVLLALFLTTVEERPVASLAVRFLDVGQGSAALVEWPDGRRWLIDGGPPGDDVLHALRRWGVDHLDVVVLTHPHPDHMGGLERVLRELPVDELRIPRLPLPSEADFSSLLAHTRARRVIGPRGAWAARSGLEVLAPPPEFDPRDNVNDGSLVTRVRYGRRSFLFPGDVETRAEAALVEGGALQADVLAAPHHGSRTSSTPAFLEAVAPEIVVISCGRWNRYGHPNGEVLRRLPGRVLRTDRDGTVTIRTDGEHLTVETDPPEGWRGR